MSSTTFGRVTILTALSCAALACSHEPGPAKTIPAGTTLIVRLTEPVSSEKHEAGDRVQAETIATLYGDASEVLIPAGTQVNGLVVNVDSYGNDRMTLTFGEIQTDGGHTCAIVGRPITVIATSTKEDLLASKGAKDVDDSRVPPTDEQFETVEIPATDDGSVDLPRGQTLAVHILESARLTASG